MKLLIVDLSHTNIDKNNSAVPAYRAILQTIFNRFLIENFTAMIEFIKCKIIIFNTIQIHNTDKIQFTNVLIVFIALNNLIFIIILECGMNVDAFMQTWFMNMEFTESKNTSKINTIAVLTILPHISAEMFSQYFGFALKRMLPDIHLYLDFLAGNAKIEKPQNTFAVRSRKDEKVASSRKKNLRQTQLYENVNLV